MNHYLNEFTARARIAERIREADEERLARTARASHTPAKERARGLRWLITRVAPAT